MKIMKIVSSLSFLENRQFAFNLERVIELHKDTRKELVYQETDTFLRTVLGNFEAKPQE